MYVRGLGPGLVWGEVGASLTVTLWVSFGFLVGGLQGLGFRVWG